jgi:(p)ppGpp synthase/HD superfamily hydrolase
MKHHEVTEAFLWSRLLPHLHHLNAREKVTLRDALKLAIRAHDGQTRKSGEPFVTHPVEVTRILAEIGCELVCFCTICPLCQHILHPAAAAQCSWNVSLLNPTPKKGR